MLGDICRIQLFLYLVCLISAASKLVHRFYLFAHAVLLLGISLKTEKGFVETVVIGINTTSPPYDRMEHCDDWSDKLDQTLYDRQFQFNKSSTSSKSDWAVFFSPTIYFLLGAKMELGLVTQSCN